MMLQRVLTNVSHEEHNDKIKNNREKITELYTWEKIVNDYEKLFLNLLNDFKTK